jgi:solute carrier family 25 protein 34/35
MYTKLKEEVLKQKFPDNPVTHCTCRSVVCCQVYTFSFIAAFGAVMANNPLDVLRSRLYNQKAHLYDGAWDAVKKITKSEVFAAFNHFLLTLKGVLAWYKGFWNHFLRVGPHYVLTFAMIEQMEQFLRTHSQQQQ